MHSRFRRILLLTAGTLLLAVQPAVAATLPASRAEVPRITVSELETLRQQAAPVIIDVRTPGQWGQATHKIPGARRLNSTADLHALLQEQAPDTPIVTYCT